MLISSLRTNQSMEQNYSISFQITHTVRDLALVSEALGVEPFRIWKAGDPRTTPTGRRLEGQYDRSYCCLRIACGDEQSASEAMSAFLTKIEAHKTLFDDLISSGGKLRLVVHDLTATTFRDEFDSYLLMRLANQGIALGIECYRPSVDDRNKDRTKIE